MNRKFDLPADSTRVKRFFEEWADAVFRSVVGDGHVAIVDEPRHRFPAVEASGYTTSSCSTQ